jgi:hypothetical protein
VLAAVAVVVLVSGSVPAFSAAIAGTVVIGVGLWSSSVRAVRWGSVGLFGAVTLVTVGGAAVEWVLTATVPVALSWALAGHSVRLGRQVPGASTWRVEAVHAVSMVVVLSVGGGVGYLVYRSSTGSSSPLALALLLGGVLAVTLALR